MRSKKILLILSLIFIVLISVSSLYYFKNKKTNNNMNVSKSNLAIIINSNDTEISSNEIPKGSYTLNEEKTICENGGKVKVMIL